MAQSNVEALAGTSPHMQVVKNKPVLTLCTQACAHRACVYRSLLCLALECLRAVRQLVPMYSLCMGFPRPASFQPLMSFVFVCSLQSSFKLQRGRPSTEPSQQHGSTQNGNAGAFE
eukprot:826625-Pleurochrysis_carterae.AAC.3